MRPVYLVGVIAVFLTLTLVSCYGVGRVRPVQMIAGHDNDALEPELADAMRRMVTVVHGEEKTYLGDQWTIRSALYLGEYEVRLEGEVHHSWDTYLVLATYTVGDRILVETGLLRAEIEDNPTAGTSTGYRSKIAPQASPGDPVAVSAFTGPLGSQYWGIFLAGYVDDDSVEEFVLELEDGRQIALNAHEHGYFTMMLDKHPICRNSPRPDPIRVERVSIK